MKPCGKSAPPENIITSEWLPDGPRRAFAPNGDLYRFYPDTKAWVLEIPYVSDDIVR